MSISSRSEDTLSFFEPAALPVVETPGEPAGDIVWLNGEFVPMERALISVEDRGLQFGDGIYEVVAARDGVPILLEEHLDRWDKSASGLRLSMRYTREQRREAAGRLLAAIPSRGACLYGQLTRGTARRVHQFPANPEPNEIWYARELPSRPVSWYAEGIPVVTHLDERWKHVWIKSTCLLPNCLAKQFAMERGAVDAILVAEDGTVRESSTANLFAVIDGVIRTHPPNGRILPGVTRGAVLDLLRANGVEVREECFTLGALRRAEEVFLTSTTINVLPVTQLDGEPVGTGKPGPVTQRAMLLFGAELKRHFGRGGADNRAVSV